MIGVVRAFFLFWYDFLVGDAWDIAAGVVLLLVAFWFVARSQPAATPLLGPLLAVGVVLLTWMSLRRETRKRARSTGA